MLTSIVAGHRLCDLTMLGKVAPPALRCNPSATPCPPLQCVQSITVPFCRFDFSHNGVIEGQRLGEVEAMCRQAVQQEQRVYSKEVALEDAQKINGNTI